jgi:hypothetical protein
MMGRSSVIPEFRVSEIFGTQEQQAWVVGAPGFRLSARSRSGRDDNLAGPP